MKNLIVLGPAYPYRGGLAAFNEKLAETFRDEGITTRIYTFRVQYPAFLFPGKSQYVETSFPRALAGMEIRRCINSVNPLNWFRVGLRIRRERPDSVVVRYWIPLMAPALGTICRIARGNGHTKILALCDNIIPHEKRFGDGFLTRYFIHSVDGFVYMSQQVKRELDSFGASQPALFAPHPIYDTYGEKVSREEACRHLNLDPQLHYLLFFGFIRDYKGLDLLLEAVAVLKARGEWSGRRLVVAGEFYADKRKYTELMERLGLTDEVLLYDRYIADEEVRYYFSAADIVVQPYRSATQSGVTQIAYQFDVPMIVTDTGGLPEIVPDGKVGFVVPVTVEAVADAIARFYKGGYRATFVSNMNEEKKRFAWSEMSGRFCALYEKIIAR